MKNIAKKVDFLVLRGKNLISPLLAHPSKILEKSLSVPSWKKIFPMPIVKGYFRFEEFPVCFRGSLKMLWQAICAPWAAISYYLEKLHFWLWLIE